MVSRQRSEIGRQRKEGRLQWAAGSIVIRY